MKIGQNKADVIRKAFRLLLSAFFVIKNEKKERTKMIQFRADKALKQEVAEMFLDEINTEISDVRVERKR